MENNESFLAKKTCTAYQGEESPLEIHKALQLLTELGKGWVINIEGQLYKEYKFNNFIEAINFANKIADIAEAEAHHPDLQISWGKCSVKIWTHKINNLTENDFILAAKINNLFS